MVITLDGAPLVAYVLASIRLVAWLLIVPPFSSRAVPTLAKTLLAFGLALTLAPTLADAAPPLSAGPLIVAAVLVELILPTLLNIKVIECVQQMQTRTL